MIIYSLQKRFDVLTGLPVSDSKQYKETRCDYTGEVVMSNDEHFDDLVYCSYNLDYGDCDPCFGASGEEFEFGDKYNVSMYDFLNQQYHFLQEYLDYHDRLPEIDMMKEFSSLNLTFHRMCRKARIRTATKLIEDKTITPDQLTG